MRDLSEFRAHWRPFAACFLGMGSALSVNNFVVSNFAPYLLEDFGWSKAQWAATGMVVALIVLCVPVAGRLADVYGVRRVAGVGAAAYPISLVAIGMLQGSFSLYLAIFMAQAVLCCTTTATIYTRLVAEKFVEWRGLALALCAGSPAVVGAIGAPLLTSLVQHSGWRAGYFAFAGFSAICGIAAIALTPPHVRQAPVAKGAASTGAAGKPVGDYRRIFAAPAFWMMLAAVFLVSAHHTLVLTQLKLLVMDQGASDTSAALLISLFAGAVIAGRILSGIALDFLPAHSVAAVFLGLPALGLLILASGLDAMPWLTLAVLLVGLAFGGEGDVVAYLVVQRFGIGVYSTVLGLLTAGMAGASAIGAGLLSLVLLRTDGFVPFLLITAVCIALGGALFQLLGTARFAREAAR